MLNRFLRLSPRERKFLIKALLWLPVAIVQARFNMRLPLEPSRPSRASAGDQRDVVSESVRMVKAAARYVRGASCLPQSIVVQRLLSAEGISTTIRIGVRKASGVLDAHAWVEHEGRPITDPAAVHHDFRVLATDSRG